MSALSDLIAENEQDDPGDTANAVFDALDVSPELRELFFPLLRDECRRHARIAARIAERSQPADTGDARSEAHDGGARAGWLTKRRYTGEHYVVLGEMTPDDHRARAAYLSTLAQGTLVTAGRHETWAEQIESAGATCLFDLDPEQIITDHEDDAA